MREPLNKKYADEKRFIKPFFRFAPHQPTPKMIGNRR